MTLVDTDKCDYCDESDTIIHRFIHCSVIERFWNNFNQMWKSLSSEFVSLTDENIIFGIYDKENYALN